MSAQPASEALVAHIAEADLRPGARLPSEREIASTLGYSQAAVNRAVLFLIGRGLLRREGHKLFVAEGADPQAPPVLWAFLPEKRPLQAARETAELCGCVLSAPDIREENQLRKALLDLDSTAVDGVLMWHSRCPDLMERLAGAGIAVVVAGAPSDDHHFVSPDYCRGASLAVEHLAALGHRQLAFISLPNAIGRKEENAGYESACRAAGLEDSAARVHSIPTHARNHVERAWKSLAPQKSGITGIICQNAQTARPLVNMARKSGLRVPGDLSVVSLLDSHDAVTGEPSLTAILKPSELVARIAILLLHDMVLHPARRSGNTRQAITLAPALAVRGSSRLAPGLENASTNDAERGAGSSTLWPTAKLWSEDRKERLQQAESLNRRPFESEPEGKFAPLDLSRFLNRSCSRQHAWLGDEPVQNLPAGEVRFHGIPFRIPDESRNAGCAAIVFRSAKAHSSGGKPLPMKLTIPARRKVAAAYFLHAAGWTQVHEAIGEYVFQYGKGVTERTSIVPFAHAAPEGADADRWLEESIVQDWHPVAPRLESGRALPCLVSGEGDPFLYERYLYAWQWVNPHPELHLASIRIDMFQPEARATLALLAITLQAEG